MPDYAELKRTISIAQCLTLLGVAVPQTTKAQLKLDCPKCGKDKLAVNTDRSIAFCHGAKEGGTILDITAHIRGCDVKASAEFLEQAFKSPAMASKSPALERKEGFKRLDGLDPNHAAVEVTGLDAKIAARAGIGYAGKGVLRGTVAVPVYDQETHELLGYLGCTDFIVPASLRGENVVEFKTA